MPSEWLEPSEDRQIEGYRFVTLDTFRMDAGKPICQSECCAVDQGELWVAMNARTTARAAGIPDPAVTPHIQKHLDEFDEDELRRQKKTRDLLEEATKVAHEFCERRQEAK